jgi:hypothetical protein
MKNLLTIIGAGLLLFATSCEKNAQDIKPATDNSEAQRPMANVAPLYTQMTVYSGGLQYAIRARLTTVSPAIPTKINNMYVIKEAVPAGAVARYIPVLNALPTTGFSAQTVWQLAYVSFGPGIVPYQFTSSADIALLVEKNAISVANTNVYYQMQMAPLMFQPVSTK